jgi:hypothetical protein
MPRVEASSSSWTKAIVGAALALLIALRLLSPPGFMPSFEHGALTIVSCPDYEPVQPTMGHHHGKSGKAHQQCPYAAASSLGAPDLQAFAIAAILLAGAVLLLGRARPSAAASWHYCRPPSRGPPILA